MELRPFIETQRSEGLKTATEIVLSGLSRYKKGEELIEWYAFGGSGRIEDEALHTEISGIPLDNPVMAGAGWDKKGRCIRGLFRLGFSAEEAGTILMFGQIGREKPRQWTFGDHHGVGLNRLGFNAEGVEANERYLEPQQPFPFPVGINVGKNNLMPDKLSPWAHAEVVKRLYRFADYFVFNPSSPNTDRLRTLQEKRPLRAHLKAMQAAMVESGGPKPLWAKIAPDISRLLLKDIIDVSLQTGIAGLIIANTTSSDPIKAKYGKQGELGGLSGNDWEYRAMVQRLAAETYERAGDKLGIIRVGAISTAEHAVEAMAVGASAVQVVTGIRETYGRVAPNINRGLLDYMDRHGISKCPRDSWYAY
jgi:dihydroorotate dehydrogenase